MFRRYGHAHSIGVGVLIAALLERHLALYLALVFVGGFVAGRSWAFWSTVAGAIRDKALRARRERIRTGPPEPVYRGDYRGDSGRIPY